MAHCRDRSPASSGEQLRNSSLKQINESIAPKRALDSFFWPRQTLPHTFSPQEIRGSLCRAVFCPKKALGSLCRAFFCHRKSAAASAEPFFAPKSPRQPLPGIFSPQEVRGSLCRTLFSVKFSFFGKNPLNLYCESPLGYLFL